MSFLCIKFPKFQIVVDCVCWLDLLNILRRTFFVNSTTTRHHLLLQYTNTHTPCCKCCSKFMPTRRCTYQEKSTNTRTTNIRSLAAAAKNKTERIVEDKSKKGEGVVVGVTRRSITTREQQTAPDDGVPIIRGSLRVVIISL